MPGKPDFLTRYLEVAPTSLALERAIECRILSGLTFPRPMLDIGCGDGTFGQLLLGVDGDIGCDVSHRELVLAKRKRVYRRLIQGDARALPLASGSVRSVLANSTLEHVLDLDAALREIARVTAPGGTVVATVPTPSYQRNLFWSRVLRRLGVRVAAGLYERAVNRAFRHHNVGTADEWVTRFARAGLSVHTRVPYLTRATIALDDLLYPLAAPSLITKMLRGGYVVLPRARRHVARWWGSRLRPLYEADAGPDGGYVLLVATSIRGNGQ